MEVVGPGRVWDRELIIIIIKGHSLRRPGIRSGLLLEPRSLNYIKTWMDTAMHDMGSLGHRLQIDLP